MKVAIKLKNFELSIDIPIAFISAIVVAMS